MSKLNVIILSTLFLITNSLRAEFRIWHDTKGNDFEAEYVCEVAGKITLRNPAGKEVKVSLKGLSKADKAYIQRLVPPKLELDFKKIQDRRKISSGHSTLDIECSATITKKSRLPYDRPLTVILVAIGYHDRNNEYTILDRAEKTIELDAQKTHTISGTSFRIHEYKYYSTSNHGWEYRGYIVAVLDADGKLISHKASSTTFSNKIEALLTYKIKDTFDKTMAGKVAGQNDSSRNFY